MIIPVQYKLIYLSIFIKSLVFNIFNIEQLSKKNQNPVGSDNREVLAITH